MRKYQVPVDVPSRGLSLSRELVRALSDMDEGIPIKIPSKGLEKCFAANCHTVAEREGFKINTRYVNGDFYIWRRITHA